MHAIVEAREAHHERIHFEQAFEITDDRNGTTRSRQRRFTAPLLRESLEGWLEPRSIQRQAERWAATVFLERYSAIRRNAGLDMGTEGLSNLGWILPCHKAERNL